MKQFIRAVGGMKNSVIYTDTDERHFRFSEGTWAWRNHNPGNVWAGSISKKHNQIGKTHGFAIFPDDESGHESLLQDTAKQPFSRKARGFNMQKILMILLFLCTTFTTVYAQDTQGKKEKDARILQLTKGAKLTDLTKSPNGKWIVFVKKSNYTIPSNCFYFSEKGELADEIWIVNTKAITKKLLVAPHFNCKDVSKAIIDPHNLQFSPDSKTLYFETSAWVTSGAIHAVDVHGNHLRLVTDQLPMLVDNNGLPITTPNEFIMGRRNLSTNTLIRNLRELSVFYSWLENEKIDLWKRIKTGQSFSEAEIK